MPKKSVLVEIRLAYYQPKPIRLLNTKISWKHFLKSSQCCHVIQKKSWYCNLTLYSLRWGHCLKSVQTESFFLVRIFLHSDWILNTRDLLLRIQGNTYQKKSVFGYFSRSGNAAKPGYKFAIFESLGFLVWKHIHI